MTYHFYFGRSRTCWTESSDADMRNLLELGENLENMETVYSGSDTVFTTNELLDNTTYYWRVLASDLNGASTENIGGIHSFLVNTENDLPGDFSLLFPEDGSMVTDLTPTLMWEVPVDEDDQTASFGNQISYLNIGSRFQNGMNSFLYQMVLG